MKLNKKGFTLVELLAVIVILAVVMLVAVTAIGPVMERANKGALASTAQVIIDGTATAFASDGLNSTRVFVPSTTSTKKEYCVKVSDLLAKNYFDAKGKKYNGSVLVSVDNVGKAEYQIYLTEADANGNNAGNYMIVGKGPNELGVDGVVNVETNALGTIQTCGDHGTAVTLNA